MKKLLFPMASFIVGIICSVTITGHASSARNPGQADDRPTTTVGIGVIQHTPVRTSINAAQDFTTPVEHSMNETGFQRHREDSMTLAVIETGQ